jgi:hypothetical protein
MNNSLCKGAHSLVGVSICHVVLSALWLLGIVDNAILVRREGVTTSNINGVHVKIM